MQNRKLATTVRQNQITQAALDIVGEGGAAALSIEKVAARVGLVPSGVYRHFKGKNQIILAILRHIDSRLTQSAQQAVTETEDAVERLHHMLTAHVGLIEADSAIPRILFTEEVIGNDPDRRRRLHSIIQGYLEMVERILRDGQRRSQIREDLDPKALAMMYLGLIQPAVIIRRVSGGKFDAALRVEEAWRVYREMIKR